MTREEFVRDICSWYDLVEFCIDEGYDELVDDIYSEESRDEDLDNEISYMAREVSSWMELRDVLDSIPEGYEYYKKDGWDWYGLDQYDFSERKDDILQKLDDDEYWDVDDVDEEEPTEEWHIEEPVEDLSPIEKEDVELSDLLIICSGDLEKIIAEQSGCHDEDTTLNDIASIEDIGIYVRQ